MRAASAQARLALRHGHVGPDVYDNYVGLSMAGGFPLEPR